MADVHVRSLERRNDQARWLRASLRYGLVDHDRILLAALVGHDAAREALGIDSPGLTDAHAFCARVHAELGPDGLARVALLLLERLPDAAGFVREAVHRIRSRTATHELANAAFRWVAEHRHLPRDGDVRAVEAAGLFACVHEPHRFHAAQALAISVDVLGDEATATLVGWALSPRSDPLSATPDPERAPRLAGRVLRGGETLGRGAVAIPFADPNVAREHARIELAGGEAWLHAVAPVFVNGARVTARQRLGHGDEVVLAEQARARFTYWA